MYNIVIAEDEAIVREGIIKTVDFEKYGFHLADMCENGKTALDAIEKYHPDVVITDICMPIMDGLELSEKIHTHYPDTKIILLTGYSDFEYARKAIELGVCEYVLKPVSSKILKEMLTKLKTRLDIEKAKKSQITQLETNLHSTKSIVIEHYLNSLIAAERSLDDVQKDFSRLGIIFNPENPAAMIIYPDNSHKIQMEFDINTDILSYAIDNVTREICADRGLVFRTESHHVIVIIKNHTYAVSLAKKIQEAVAGVFDTTVSVFIGCHVTDVSKICLSYENAEYIRSYHQMFQDGAIIDCTSIKFDNAVTTFYNKQYDKRIAEYVKQGMDCRCLINKMASDIKNLFLPYADINVYIKNLVSMLLSTTEEMTLSPFTGYCDIPDFREDVTIECVADALYRFISDCTAHISLQKGGTEKQLVEKAKQYIRENYKNPQISLKDICSHLCVSSSYFSAKFKSETGITFVEYLTRIRIDKAKTLLKTTSLKSYEIACEVGYPDSHYFSVIFKKHTGISPKEYKENEKLH